MAKPRVFISSTFYDLKQIRSDLFRFVEEMGYEPVDHDQGQIPYSTELALEEYCYKEIEHVDILVSIIGSRFGSESASNPKKSISQIELTTALKRHKQVYIFIDKNVLSEYETYLFNKDVEGFKPRHASNIEIYKFIEEIKSHSHNNQIYSFDSAADISRYLKTQWAGLFQRFLQQVERNREVDLISELSNTASTLQQLVKYLASESKNQNEAFKSIVSLNHPVFRSVKKALNVPYRIVFLNLSELKALLEARFYSEIGIFDEGDRDDMHGWERRMKNKVLRLYISSKLFNKAEELVPMTLEEWNDDFVQVTEHEIIDDEIPF